MYEILSTVYSVLCCIFFQTKPLGVIWGKFEEYSSKNTIMFDDLRRNFLMNPQNGLKVNMHVHPGYSLSILRGLYCKLPFEILAVALQVSCKIFAVLPGKFILFVLNAPFLSVGRLSCLLVSLD